MIWSADISTWFEKPWIVQVFSDDGQEQDYFPERTCHMIYRGTFKPHHDFHRIECSECGGLFFQTKGYLPVAHYCPNCGAKVVEE